MIKSKIFTVLFLLLLSKVIFAQQSSFVQLNPNGTLNYTADIRGNTIPDFSAVGYRRSNTDIPNVQVVKTISPAESGSSEEIIQAAIDEVSQMPLVNGFRGAILFKKGIYNIPGSIYVSASGIVLRGEGQGEDGTVWRATGTGQRTLLEFLGTGTRERISSTRSDITNSFVPVGSFSFDVSSVAGYSVGDQIVLTRPGTDKWIQDLQMDVIPRVSTNQWKANEYHLYYEREITRIEGNKVYIDNPVVMEMEDQYGGGYIEKYDFPGRISDVGVENMRLESDYASNTDEDHGWVAVMFTAAQHGWVKDITSRYFGYSLAHMSGSSKYITVLNSNCLDPKSQVEGGRRYSFNIAGRAQLNLVKGCYANDGRHDYVTGSRTAGPNVFVNSQSVNAQSDIGPHQRWATGTLYDNIVTDGVINVQDRGDGGGDWQNGDGNGHGWTGVTQVLWNCTAEKTSVQSPWVSGKNYAIAVQGPKYGGTRYPSSRPDGEWELHNSNVTPVSLYEAQLNARRLALVMDVSLNSFVAELKDGQIHVRWASILEQNITSFELLHSTDGLNFTAIASLPANNNNNSLGYNFVHANISSGTNYYKISLKNATTQSNLPYTISISGVPVDNNLVFKQDFNQGTFVSDFVKSDAPNNIFFDVIGTTSTGSTYAKAEVINGKFVIDRSSRPASSAPTERIFLTRSTDLNPATQFIKLQLKFSASNIPTSGNTQAAIHIGENFINDGEGEDDNSWEKISITHAANGFRLRDGTTNTQNGTIYPADGTEHTLTFYLNATDSDQTYTGPDGNTHTILAQSWNAFVGSDKQFGSTESAQNRGPVAPTKAIKNFKFLSTSSSAIYVIDDFIIEALPISTTPVTLTSFTGSRTVKGNELLWKTASEQKNSHFEILRSTDGINFTQIGEKTGNGSTQQMSNYSFIDKLPLAGVNYYKLKQVDLDGKSEEFGPLAIEYIIDSEQLRIESITGDMINIGFSVNKEQQAELFITDILGRKLYNISLHLKAGYHQNQIPFNPSKRGLYIISLISGDEKYVLKFIN